MNWTLLCQLIVLFFVFSVLGWMMEVTLKYIQYHRFINRGFLIGPYCPIYATRGRSGSWACGCNPTTGHGRPFPCTS